MEIKWHNLIALLFFLLAIVLLATQMSSIITALNTLGQIGPAHPPDRQAMGLMCLGLVLIAILAALRIICANRDR